MVAINDFILDSIATPSAVACSFRKIRANWIGSALRLRNSTNVELNIGFKTITYGSEVVTNGTFNSDVSNWTGSSIAWSSGRIAATVSGFQGAYQVVTGLTIGQMYRLDFEIAAVSSGATGRLYVSQANTPYSNNLINRSSLDVGVGAMFFTATATSHAICLSSTGGSGTITWDNISCRSITATTGGGDFDLVAVATHCGTGSGFVTSWYDQSGNARDAAQATAASQPRVMNSGVLDLLNGRPTIRFLGSQELLLPTAPISNSAESDILFVARNDSLSSWSSLFELADDGGANGRYHAHVPGADGNIYFDAGGSTAPNRISGSSGITQGVAFQSTFANSVSGGYQVARVNGTQRAGDASGHSVAVSRLRLGSGMGLPMTGSISEVILFGSALSLNLRQTVERNQGAAFGVTIA
jgi:hypothetical protein